MATKALSCAAETTGVLGEAEERFQGWGLAGLTLALLAPCWGPSWRLLRALAPSLSLCAFSPVAEVSSPQKPTQAVAEWTFANS